MKSHNHRTLFIIGWPLNHGGHIHSTLAHIKYLNTKNLKLFLLAPKGEKINEFENAGAEYFKMPRFFIFAITKIIYIIIFKQVNIIHAMDYKSLKRAIIVKLICRVPVVFTKAGGPIPKYKVPPVDSIIVFSKELFDQISITSTDSKIYLIKERIDFDLFRKSNVKKTNQVKTVLMAMRFEPQKQHWLENIFMQIEINSKMLSKYKFVFAGDGKLFDHFHSIAKRINSNTTSDLVSLIGGIDNINEMINLYNSANIVIGHGRGIIEAMACGKEVVLLGENGEFEVVNENNIDEISYYNFSGRHFKLKRNIKNQDFSECLKMCKAHNYWNIDYVLENYNAETGCDKIIAIYNQLKFSANYKAIIGWLYDKNRN